MLVHHFLEVTAESHAYKEAAVHLDSRISYLELEKASNRLANYFIENDVKSKERVAILLDSSINYIITYFAILKAGGVVVALNTMSALRNLKSVLSDCNVSGIVVNKRQAGLLKAICLDVTTIKLAVCDGETDKIPASLKQASFFDIQMHSDHTRPFLKIKDDDNAQIIYTSGTTGSPKGVTLTHKNLFANTKSIVEYLGLKADDKVMSILPFYYSYGNSLLLTHIFAGGTLVIDNRFAYPNVVLDIMAAEKVTGFSGVPSTFAILMHKSNISNYRFDHLRYLTQAGGPMTPALTQKIMEMMPHIKIYIMYGQTEASARLSYLEPEMLLEKIGSIGKAIPDVELKIVDKKGRECKPGEVGEIIARGDNIMIGYWNKPKDTSMVLKDSWLYTGDLARSDEDGYLYIVSRLSDMIKSGAHRISPKEIEEIIAEYPDIVESAIVGVEDEILGEAIIAFIVCKNQPDQRKLRKHLRLNLAVFKIPREIIEVTSLPKTASGKIKKYKLIEDYSKQVRP